MQSNICIDMYVTLFIYLPCQFCQIEFQCPGWSNYLRRLCRGGGTVIEKTFLMLSVGCIVEVSCRFYGLLYCNKLRIFHIGWCTHHCNIWIGICKWSYQHCSKSRSELLKVSFTTSKCFYSIQSLGKTCCLCNVRKNVYWPIMFRKFPQTS